MLDELRPYLQNDGGADPPELGIPVGLVGAGAFVGTAVELQKLQTVGEVAHIWVWLKIKQEGLRRFWSMFLLARVPVWCRFFEPQPYCIW